MNLLAQRAGSSRSLIHSDVTLCLVLDLELALYIVQPACTIATRIKAAIHPKTMYSLVSGKFQNKLALSLLSSSFKLVITEKQFV